LAPKTSRKVDAEDEEAMLRSQMRRGLAIPEKLFAVIGELGLFTRSIGGEHYPTPSTDEDLIRRANFPLKLRPTIELLGLELGSHASRHLYRSATMCSSVGAALKLSSHQSGLARDAVLLMASSLTRKDRSLLRSNFLNVEAAEVRMTLASRMKDSAMKVAIEMGNPEVGQAISAAARVLSGELEGSSDEMALVGAIVVATEITDRICYQSGHWNPRAAHYLMRKCKNGEMAGIPPSVLACIIKLLSEAIAARQLSMLVNKAARSDPALKEEARRVREDPVAQNEEKISMDKLLPGMRLSRPIRTYDGRLVLAEDLILDQDLIWRLWQLSAVRPLNAPVVILAKNFSAPEPEKNQASSTENEDDGITQVVH